MGGYIMQLQDFSVNDGEGIRTIIFMAGCPLRCAWCSNPEGQTLRNPMTLWAEAGKIIEHIRHQAIFYRSSGGGVTFSGGEATAQPDFLAELAGELYDEGFDLAIETCGFFSFDRLRPTLLKMGRIFMDLKCLDSAKHRAFTGVDNGLILKNLAKTAALGVPMTIRIPTILGVNAADEDMAAAFDFIAGSCRGASLELLPYHRYGEAKYAQLGLRAPGSELGTPSPEQLERWLGMARERGIETVSFK